MEELLNVMKSIKSLLYDLNANVEAIKDEISEIKGIDSTKTLSDVCDKLDKIRLTLNVQNNQ
ncbi:hypothetical protein Q428_05360 [Fervidicella metallireducens AeB]|uniref:Uncharacterized protein n=1 Tax=Fervidicella metallireducens AeB TaxID=1403537 RepID=A0A017RWA0_9CLOT|nr:hypothetical protein [Fervidicella metallireducens]EYE88952.1 hypothetical protein Q428_05360 [Fervidicella metallireducens AeB]